MILYHGSEVKVCAPEIRASSRTLDYGAGFYTTTSQVQAEAWVRRRLGMAHIRRGYVNEYAFDVGKMKNLRCLSFAGPTEEWLDFVMLNRTKRGFSHAYDIVYGPVANDRVYAAFALYEGGILDKQGLITELRTYKLVDQYLFHTERSLHALTFISAREVTL